MSHVQLFMHAKIHSDDEHSDNQCFTVYVYIGQTI